MISLGSAGAVQTRRWAFTQRRLRAVLPALIATGSALSLGV
jgi:hypothetical protein